MAHVLEIGNVQTVCVALLGDGVEPVVTIVEQMITEPVGMAIKETEFVARVGRVVQDGDGVEQLECIATIALPSHIHHQALQAVALVVAHPLTTTPPRTPLESLLESRPNDQLKNQQKDQLDIQLNLQA